LRAGPGDALMGLMPVAAGGDAPLWALKAVLVARENPARGLDSHQGVVLLCDGQTGRPQALVDATAITALRTAAASAVATQALARPDVRRVAILGGGTQARSHVAAMRMACPGARIVLWSRAGAGALAAALGVEPAATARAALAGADVVCTVTASDRPILDPLWLAEGAHVNAVGASRPDARELGSDLIAAAELFVDSRAQAELECGEYLIPLREGRIGPGHVRAELGAVLRGRHPGRSGPGALTVFKSLGIAAEDLAAAQAAVARARSLGLGTVIDWPG
jgi:ornithine cyclodeaminase